MTEREELKLRLEQAIARLKRNRRLCHVRWADGHLETMSVRTDGKADPVAVVEVPFQTQPEQKKRRTIVQQALEL